MEYLYKGLVNTTSSVGRAFTYAERVMIDKAKYYGAVREYNLYGDPKLGELPAAGSQEEMRYGGALLEAPPAHHQVVVPDYVVSQIGDRDLVDIPDGTVTQAAGEPRLPIYAAQLTYPAGYQVQEVVLTGRSEPVETTGLHIPEPLLITKTLLSAWSEPQGVPEARWYPERAFEWHTAANGDGSTTLTLLLYPFHYNPATTDARFYRVWDFDIHAVTSPVTITALTTDRSVYEQGAPVTVTLDIANAAEPQDVVVEARILRYGSDEVVSGLLLRTLHDLEGSASFSPVWGSDPQPAGYYVVEAALRRPDGTLLARERALFRLGIAAVELTGLEVTPSPFEPGEAVDLSLQLRNDGTIPLTVTVVMQVKDGEGQLVAEMQAEATALEPQTATGVHGTWDTSGLARGRYTIAAYALYDGLSSEVLTAEARTAALPEGLYVPLIVRNGP